MQMKHNPNPRRGRNRGNGKRHVAVRNQTFESNGPEGKIRGTAQQVLDKYMALGRDATSAGDPITAESFFQHAEHYFRLLHAADLAAGDRNPDRGARPDPANQPQPGSEDDNDNERADGNGREVAIDNAESLPF
jgi:hypothetical protein